MENRNFSTQDRLIGEIDKIIKLLSVKTHPSRSPRNAPEADSLPQNARIESIRLMRVNHSGEIAAQGLYQGQALTARDAEVKSAMQAAAAEEIDHLAWCEQRLEELQGRTSALNPAWYLGSLALGAFAGLLGDKASLGFIAETEKQVEAHLGDHLQRMSPLDIRSRAILEQMRGEEVEHGAKAEAMGGKELPFPLKFLMRAVSKVMTQTSYWV